MARRSGTLEIDFANCQLGVNTNELPIRLKDGMVSDCENAIFLEGGGIKRRPGVKALSTSQTFTSYLKGLFNYQQIDGTERLIAVENEDIHSVNTNTGALTKLYDIGGTGEAYAANARDKLWICNGNDVVKVEGTTVYPVGIAAPSGSGSSAQAGGTLPDGVYKIFAVYYRKVSGSIVLYSTGESVSDVTLSGGNNTVRVTVPATSDPNMSGAAVFMTTAGGAVYYRYATSDGAGPFTIDITSDTKNTSILYTVNALFNGRPPAFDTNIVYHDNRIWGTYNGQLYFSKKGFTVYDLEKFPGSNRIPLPYRPYGLFIIGEHLYISTFGGVYMLPYGDPNGELVLTDDRWYIRHIRTAQPIEGGIIALTNSGVRLFDGRRFSEQNISFNITPQIKETISVNDNFLPVGQIYNRTDRTEYILSFQDTTKSAANNNIRAVLNLDTLARGAFAWEFWTCGANYFAVTSNNTLYAGQSHATRSSVYTEQNNTQDEAIIGYRGSLISTAENVRLYVKTRTHLEDLWSIVKQPMNIGAILFSNSDVSVRIISADDIEIKDNMSISDTGQGDPIVFPGVFNQMVFAAESTVRSATKSIDGVTAYAFYLEIEQSANDIKFEIDKLVLFAHIEYSRFTL